MPRPPVFKVLLSSEDRAGLERVARTGPHPTRMMLRARVLLELDENAGPIALRVEVADRVGVSVNTVGRVAHEFVESGGDVDAVIARRKRVAPPVEPKLTGDVEARLIALACSSPPQGHTRWSLRLLEKHVALTDGMPALDHSTIGRALRKHNFVPDSKMAAVTRQAAPRGSRVTSGRGGPPPAEQVAGPRSSALRVIVRAEDSSGIIGDAIKTMLALHAQLAVAAPPPQAKLVA